MWFAIEEYDEADFADVEDTYYEPDTSYEYVSEDALARECGCWIDDSGNWIPW